MSSVLSLPGTGSVDGDLDGELRAQTGRKFSVLVVDEHELILCGMRLMLGTQSWVERCLAATDAATALELARRFEPRVAVVDVRLGRQGSVEVCQALRAAAPPMRIVLMTGAERLSPQTVASLGACGYTTKGSSARDILRTIRRAGLGLRLKPQAAPALLSARQHEILELLAAGGTNSEIATRLYLSAHTVKQHTSAVYRKLKARNRAEAIHRAQELGLLA